MTGQEAQEVERKILSILKVLRNAREPMGARVISLCMKDLGIDLGERAVRYHLKQMDERGLTQLIGRRDGRLITTEGIIETGDALVRDKIGLAYARIELLAFCTDFDLNKGTGIIPMNVCFFQKAKFNKALQEMKPIFARGVCVSDRVAIAKEGECLGDLVVPKDYVGLATVCSIVINGTLLKAGIPIDSRFGGILQIRNGKPLRFVELIHYTGTSIDPSELFIKAGMTYVKDAVNKADGKILANFREMPAACRPVAEEVLNKLRESGISGLLLLGNPGEPACEIGVRSNRIGMILYGGLNPVAAAVESGIEIELHAMSTVMEYQKLIKIWEI
jgi:HTH-type transcriptional regulator, global nitrogen regulator NrpRI